MKKTLSKLKEKLEEHTIEGLIGLIALLVIGGGLFSLPNKSKEPYRGIGVGNYAGYYVRSVPSIPKGKYDLVYLSDSVLGQGLMGRIDRKTGELFYLEIYGEHGIKFGDKILNYTNPDSLIAADSSIRACK